MISLDDFLLQYTVPSIDFIKLDAEGEEVNILEGAISFFEQQSPLIMFELIHGKIVDNTLLKKFDEIQFNLYRLLPGLNVLVPFDPEYYFDKNFFLNIFACQEDRAIELEKQGYLLRSIDVNSIPSNATVSGEWLHYMHDKPFHQMFASSWESFYQNPFDSQYWSILQKIGYILNGKNHLSIQVNMAFAVREELLSVIEDKKSFPIIATLIRIDLLLGFRTDATILLQLLIDKFAVLREDKLHIPFVPVLERYESFGGKNKQIEWFASSILECFELMRHFSSYYTGRQTLPYLEKLQELGLASEEIKRRYKLVKEKNK